MLDVHPFEVRSTSSPGPDLRVGDIAAASLSMPIAHIAKLPGNGSHAEVHSRTTWQRRSGAPAWASRAFRLVEVVFGRVVTGPSRNIQLTVVRRAGVRAVVKEANNRALCKNLAFAQALAGIEYDC